jgi:hypothetical protein
MEAAAKEIRCWNTTVRQAGRQTHCIEEALLQYFVSSHFDVTGPKKVIADIVADGEQSGRETKHGVYERDPLHWYVGKHAMYSVDLRRCPVNPAVPPRF